MGGRQALAGATLRPSGAPPAGGWSSRSAAGWRSRWGCGPARALLNDINPHLINFYRWLKRGLRIDIQMENDAALYYAHRARFNALVARAARTTSAEAAELFYYLNRTGYNGLCRFNRRAGSTSPSAATRASTTPTDFTPYRDVLSSLDVHRRRLRAARLGPDDFVYADPPYDVEFTQYTKDGFAWADQVRLAHWLARPPRPGGRSPTRPRRDRAPVQRPGLHPALPAAPRAASAAPATARPRARCWRRATFDAVTSYRLQVAAQIRGRRTRCQAADTLTSPNLQPATRPTAACQSRSRGCRGPLTRTRGMV